jgi:hypothetical protein
MFITFFFYQILMTPRLRQLVIGENIYSAHEANMPLLIQLYKSLVEVMIQSVESTTRDVREMLRLLRILWPFYLKPLLQRKDEAGDDFISKSLLNSNIDNDCFVLLGQKVRPFIRRLINECLLQPGRTLRDQSMITEQDECNDVSSLSYYSIFLLLAAYLCQANKADHDQKLYTNKASGQRRRQMNNKPNDTFAESVTHASSSKAQQRLRSEKIPSFPLERLLSIYSSITGKYAIGSKNKGSQFDVGNLGSIALYSNLAELRQLGFLTCVNANNNNEDDKSRVMASTWIKYVCNISRNDALLLAKKVKFPLTNYLAENM